MDYKQLIEALIYLKGEDGLSCQDFKLATNMPLFNARKQLHAFKKEFNASNRGLVVVEFNNIFKFVTKPELKDDISRVMTPLKNQKLSNAAVETVAIIAYHQGITKSEINKIRNVSSEVVVNTLLVKGLIEEKGLAKTAGHPVLYGITNKFYDYFCIKSLKELPQLSEIYQSDNLDDNFDLYSSQRED